MANSVRDIHPPLLEPKLSPPRLPGSLVVRERLLAQLDTGQEGKLTLIAAPAGFGKTTLASQWVADRRERGTFPPVAWVALDAGDNDPVRFWRYVITACRAFDVNLGESILESLHAAHPSFGPVPLEPILTTFLNALSRLPDRGILVLEDYHLITNPQIHDAMTFLLDHLPATVHVILLTRSEPPLPLARWRARSELYDIRSEDLRFTPEETATFFQQTLAFPLAPEAMQHLETYVEGWPAGLRLITLALKGYVPEQRVEDVLPTFGGSHRHFLEFFVTEVLDAQPKSLQVFLLETSGLSRLTGALCDAVTERNDSARLLETVERAGLFLLPLGGVEPWYRYHPLFAEAMQHEARRRLGDERVRAVSSRASLWYEQHGLLAEAVESALAAQDFERAATLIEEIVAPELVKNEHHTLRRWIARLPEVVLRDHPALCLSYAIAILFTSDRYAPETMAQLQPPLQMAEEYWRAENNRNKLGEVLAFRSLVTWFQWNLPQAVAEARQALELLAEENVEWRGISLIFVGLQELLDGTLNQARQTLLKALELCKAAGNIYGITDTMLLLAPVYTGQGELRQAAQVYQQVITEVERTPMDSDMAYLRRGRALAGLSGLDLEWNLLETAEMRAAEALDIAEALADEQLQADATMALARTEHARGAHEQAQERLRALLAETRRPSIRREVETCQARLALLAGDLSAAEQWHATRTERNDVPRLYQEQEALVVARLLLAQGDVEAALRLLGQWQIEARAENRRRSELEILVLKALAYDVRGEQAEAQAAIMEALSLARGEGYQRLFMDEGEPMAVLLKRVLPEVRAEPLGAYVRTLLLAFPQSDAEQTPTAPPASAFLVEPLSPQEQRVLRLLVAGLTNVEIAEELVVSVNTVKTHVKNIYRKLDVTSRREARDAAHQLNLI